MLHISVISLIGGKCKVGGEAFHTYSRCNLSDFQVNNIEDWSGKIEVSANWMLNRQKTLKFNARFYSFLPVAAKYGKL